MDLEEFEKIFREKVAEEALAQLELTKRKTEEESGLATIIEASRMVAADVCARYLVNIILPAFKETVREINKKGNKKE